MDCSSNVENSERTDQVESSIRASTNPCPCCGHHPALCKPRRQLVAIAEVRLPTAQHGAIDGHHKGGVSGGAGPSYKCREDVSALKTKQSLRNTFSTAKLKNNTSCTAAVHKSEGGKY